MLAYKLLRKRRDNSLGPLFINRSQRITPGVWMQAHLYPTRGYQVRQGWHCTLEPVAPHLTTRGRVWCQVSVKDIQYYSRPESQGGTWVLAQRMKLIKELT